MKYYAFVGLLKTLVVTGSNVTPAISGHVWSATVSLWGWPKTCSLNATYAITRNLVGMLSICSPCLCTVGQACPKCSNVKPTTNQTSHNRTSRAQHPCDTEAQLKNKIKALHLKVVALKEHIFHLEGEIFMKLHMAPTDLPIQPEPPTLQDTAMQ